MHGFGIKLLRSWHQRSVTLYDEVLDLFTLRIINVGAVRSVADALQERRFTSVRSADDKDPKMANAIKVLFDFGRIQMNFLFEIFCN